MSAQWGNCHVTIANWRDLSSAKKTLSFFLNKRRIVVERNPFSFALWQNTFLVSHVFDTSKIHSVLKSQKNVSFLKIASEASFKMYQNSNLNFSLKNIFFWRNFFIFLFWLWDIFLNFQTIVEESLQDYAKMVWRVAKKCRISRIRLLSYEIKSAERWEVFLFFCSPSFFV